MAERTTRQDFPGEDKFQSVRVTWWVAFTAANPAKGGVIHEVWRWLAKRRFAHCYAFTFHAGEWIIINPLWWWLKVDVVPNHFYEQNGYLGMVDFAMRHDGAKVVKVETKIRPNYVPRILPLMCVTVVKSLLGVRSRAVTPFGLYKQLLRGCHGVLDAKPAEAGHFRDGSSGGQSEGTRGTGEG